MRQALRLFFLVTLGMCAGCSLLFRDGSPEPLDRIPELRYSFANSSGDSVQSTGSLDLDLRLEGSATVEDGSLNLLATAAANPGFAVSEAPASGFIQRCIEARALTVALWFSPGSTSPIDSLPARIVAMEESPNGTPNFTLSQGTNDGQASGFDALSIRTTRPREGGGHLDSETLGLQVQEPVWAAAVLDASTSFEDGNAFLYVDDAVVHGVIEIPMPGWSTLLPLSIGNTSDPEASRQWRGLVHHLELHCDALSPEQLRVLREATVPGPQQVARTASTRSGSLHSRLF